MRLAEIFGRNVRKARLAKGWSQEQLAFESNLQRSYISEIETGKRNPTLDVVETIARVLEVRVIELLAE
ncbi:helix-turn-helix domain-containing protein [Pelagibacterium luteolum]|uniref:Helix-turn-helix n=1 Tax=Pelagibacterium luteolum TaxID=440168 RepID=A0A1G7U2Z5_9HYPH|nr:helix-turn-helix transcriptional regulator [Pelagibacterium luteolum]MAN77679.1 XRE family transcriptional regulator [Hyphomicrobiales bacterium]SDG41995.1 Helix-turn-helix [Pelagibacterium luteolum]|tara:strand:- start:3336 stop:3542 length:207 start_codon:yes stop_codon:yes gene_type:complete